MNLMRKSNKYDIRVKAFDNFDLSSNLTVYAEEKMHRCSVRYCWHTMTFHQVSVSSVNV